MMRQRTLASCVFLMAGMTWAATTAAQEKDIERSEHATWRMALKLDTPSLIPPAVQWAILDKDPVPGFRARLRRMQSYYRNRLKQADDEATRELIRSSHMIISWDLGFKEVTGDKVYLLTSVPGVFHSVQSNAAGSKKWIVTKIVRINGKPVCWCIPVKVKTGKRIQISLTEDNTFDLEPTFDEAMQESSHTE